MLTLNQGSLRLGRAALPQASPSSLRARLAAWAAGDAPRVPSPALHAKGEPRRDRCVAVRGVSAAPSQYRQGDVRSKRGRGLGSVRTRCGVRLGGKNRSAGPGSESFFPNGGEGKEGRLSAPDPAFRASVTSERVLRKGRKGRNPVSAHGGDGGEQLVDTLGGDALNPPDLRWAKGALSRERAAMVATGTSLIEHAGPPRCAAVRLRCDPGGRRSRSWRTPQPIATRTRARRSSRHRPPRRRAQAR